MQKIYLSLFTILFCFQAQAASKKFGLGVQLGDPTGISMRYRIKRKNSLAMALGSKDSRINLNAVYLFEKSRVFKLDHVPVDFYYGIGGRLKEIRHDGDDEMSLGARAPAGLKILFKSTSIEIFGEIAGTLDLTPDTDVDIDASIGARYFF